MRRRPPRTRARPFRTSTTIFYLGEFNSGGTKVSLPILNKANIPQISPSNTYVGLTTDEPGSEPGEPDKYYPAQKRTYARIVPTDTIQGAALATIMKEDGCKSVHIFNDKTTYGAGLAKNVETAAKDIGLTVEGNDGTDKNAPNYRSLAVEDQGRLLRRLGRDRRELRPGVQGRGGGLPELQAVRTGRRGRGGVHRPEGGRHPGGRRRPHEGHGRHAQP